MSCSRVIPLKKTLIEVSTKWIYFDEEAITKTAESEWNGWIMRKYELKNANWDEI